MQSNMENHLRAPCEHCVGCGLPPIGSAGLRNWVSGEEGAASLQSCAAAVTAANEPIKRQQIMLHVRHDFTRVGCGGWQGVGQEWAATVGEHA